MTSPIQGAAVEDPLAEQAAVTPGQPSTVRIGVVQAVTPLQIALGGPNGTVVDPDALGIAGLYQPRVGDVVALLGQSVDGSQSSGFTWLVLGSVSPGSAGSWATKSSFAQTAYNVTSTSYIVTGVVDFCSVPFYAPPSGKVLLHWSAEINHGTSFCLVSPQIATGPGPASGTVVVAASDDRTVRNDAAAVTRPAHTDLIDTLTPLVQYNCTLYHRVGAGTGVVGRRRLVVQPVH